MYETAVEKCITIGCRHIEAAMRPGAETAWRWGLAETWFRTAERLIRNGAI